MTDPNLKKVDRLGEIKAALNDYELVVAESSARAISNMIDDIRYLLGEVIEAKRETERAQIDAGTLVQTNNQLRAEVERLNTFSARVAVPMLEEQIKFLEARCKAGEHERDQLRAEVERMKNPTDEQESEIVGLKRVFKETHMKYVATILERDHLKKRCDRLEGALADIKQHSLTCYDPTHTISASTPKLFLTLGLIAGLADKALEVKDV